MIDVLLLVITIIVVFHYWQLFVPLAIVAGAGVIYAQDIDDLLSSRAEAAPSAYVLYRDDSRTAFPAQVEVGRFGSRDGCEIAGRALSAYADRVEVHYCAEAR
jgi:hypothetical protein